MKVEKGRKDNISLTTIYNRQNELIISLTYDEPVN